MTINSGASATEEDGKMKGSGEQCGNDQCVHFDEKEDSRCIKRDWPEECKLYTPLKDDKEPVADVPCNDGLSLPDALDNLLLEARGIAKTLADNAKHDLCLESADYWYDIEKDILDVYDDLQKAT